MLNQLSFRLHSVEQGGVEPPSYTCAHTDFVHTLSPDPRTVRTEVICPSPPLGSLLPGKTENAGDDIIVRQ